MGARSVAAGLALWGATCVQPAVARVLSAANYNLCTSSSGPIVLQPAGPGPPPWSEDMAAFFADYRPLADIDRFIDALQATYAEFLTVTPLGRSWEGRPLRLLRLAGPGPVVPADRPLIYLQAGAHAREWIGPATLLHVARAALSGARGGGAAEQQLLADFELALLPVANPDGYLHSWGANRMWRKTRSNRTACANGEVGVDANRNWGFMWAQTEDAQYGAELRDPCTNVYAGPAPFSEPEVRAVADFLRGRQNRSLAARGAKSPPAPGRLAAFVDYHSYAQMLLPPWAYATDATPDADYQRGLVGALAASMRGASGRVFEVGPNLLPSDPGTAPDWAYGELGVRASLTVELEGTYNARTAFCLPKEEIQSVGEEQWAAVKALAGYLRAKGSEPSELVASLPSVAPNITVQGSVASEAAPPAACPPPAARLLLALCLLVAAG